jgi:hypothetical protein
LISVATGVGVPCGNGGANITVGVAVKSFTTEFDLTLLKYTIDSKYSINNVTVNFRILLVPSLQFYTKLR